MDKNQLKSYLTIEMQQQLEVEPDNETEIINRFADQIDDHFDIEFLDEELTVVFSDDFGEFAERILFDDDTDAMERLFNAMHTSRRDQTIEESYIYLINNESEFYYNGVFGKVFID